MKSNTSYRFFVRGNMEFKVDDYRVRIHRLKPLEKQTQEIRRLSNYVSIIFQLGKKYIPEIKGE